MKATFPPSTTLRLILAGCSTLIFAAKPALTQTFAIIHNFTGEADGGNPLAGLTIDKNGNLYGTANYGGSGGQGTAFKLEKSSAGWTFNTLHNFGSGTDGSYPTTRLMPDANDVLYGMTPAGGTAGHGTVFSLAAGPSETVLYNFTDGTGAGEAPSCNLIFDKAGNMYGTTSTGGANGSGTVFMLVKPKSAGGVWTEKVLHTFGSGTDGAIPIAGVTVDGLGNLFGTTSAGGASGYGVVYQLKLTKSGWMETILHDFENGTDGSVLYGGLIVDKAGNLYGSATQGGTAGGGTIFELTPSGGGWSFNVLYSLPGWDISGMYRNLTLDAAGNIYGTSHCDGADESGTVYKLSPSANGWTYTSLHDFSVTDGQYVFSGLVFDQQGNIYGTAQVGGANGYGVVWEITP